MATTPTYLTGTRYKNFQFLPNRNGQVIILKDGLNYAVRPLKVVAGLSALEIVTALEANQAAGTELQRLASELRVEFPRVTFGYIGNLEVGWDDRSFSIFLPTVGVGTYADRVGGYAAWELVRMVADWPQLLEVVRRKMVGR